MGAFADAGLRVVQMLSGQQIERRRGESKKKKKSKTVGSQKTVGGKKTVVVRLLSVR